MLEFQGLMVETENDDKWVREPKGPAEADDD